MSTETVASMVSPQRWMEKESWCHGAARPCLPRSLCTQPPKAAFSMEATVEAAAQEERDEVVREFGEECMKISGRSWTIKPGLVALCCSLPLFYMHEDW